MLKSKLKTVASFKIPYLQYLDEKSQTTQKFPVFAQDPKILIHFYQQMSLTRILDNKAVKLQRKGEIGTYPSSQGQEAIGVGTGAALKKEDVYCPYYRESGAVLQRGVKIEEVLSIWGGDERGNNFETNREDFTLCVPIATQCLHSAGVAFAFKHRKEPRVAVTSIGEGGTSKGDFYEAMNLASAWQLPVVFIVNNNQWAISVPRVLQTHSKTVAQKAIAAGMEGIQVDGNDIIAVYHAISDAIERARKAEGPSLIEAVSYRLCDHTTADDATRYQPSEDVRNAWKKEPIARLRNYLETEGFWSKEKENEMQKKLIKKVDTAIQNYLKKPKDQAVAMFDSLYAKLPEAYLDQRNDAERYS